MEAKQDIRFAVVNRLLISVATANATPGLHILIMDCQRRIEIHKLTKVQNEEKRHKI
jgi:hypothetical protein